MGDLLLTLGILGLACSQAFGLWLEARDDRQRPDGDRIIRGVPME